MALQLIIDDRERVIAPYLATEFKNCPHIVKRLEIGDYAIVNSLTSVILAVFERKTLNDFAASIKDGRHNNKDKMIALRKSTGCKVFYIIEGNPFTRPTQSVARIPYYVIESAIFHLMMRDNIFVLYTKDPQHTIGVLMRFMKSAENLEKKMADVDGVCEPHCEINAIDSLTQKPQVNKLNILRKMWAQFAGISSITADVFIARYSVRQALEGIPAEELANLRMGNGAKLGKKAIVSLTAPTKPIDRILACVPRVSIDIARKIVAQPLIMQCLAAEKPVNFEEITAEKLADIEVSPKRKLGKKLANDIIEYIGAKWAEKK